MQPRTCCGKSESAAAKEIGMNIRKTGMTVRAMLIVVALCCGAQAQQLQKPPSPIQRPTGSGSVPTQQHPLTDGDVILMVESGKPEAVIVSTIRSSRTNFDLSPLACRTLTEKHVSRTILDAMGNVSGQPPCASTSGTSKPQTPAAVEQCVAACTAQCQKVAGNSARLAMCRNDCVQRC